MTKKIIRTNIFRRLIQEYDKKFISQISIVMHNREFDHLTGFMYVF